MSCSCRSAGHELGCVFPDNERALYRKFTVRRTDGRSEHGEKHENCSYFVLDLVHDPHALPAILSYANSCQESHPELAKALRKLNPFGIGAGD